MTTDSTASTAPQSKRFTPARITVSVYLLTALAIWWWYPGSPRFIIPAGPEGRFAGFTPDGKKILTCTKQTVWNLWDVESGQKYPDMLSQNPDQAIGFTEDGQRIYIGEHYFSVATGEKLPGKRYRVRGDISSIGSESPDGSLLAVAGMNGITVTDPKTADVHYTIPPGIGAAFTPSGEQLIVTCDPRKRVGGMYEGPLRWEIKSYDAATGKSEKLLIAGDGSIYGRAFGLHENRVVMAIWQNAPEKKEEMGLQVWNLATGQREHFLTMNQEQLQAIRGLRFLNEGRVVTAGATLGLGGFAWDLTLPMPEALIGSLGFSVPPMQLTSDGTLAAWCDHQKKEMVVQQLGVSQTKFLYRRSYPAQQSLTPIAITSNGKLILNAHRINRGTFFDKFLASKQPRCEVRQVPSGKLLGTVPQPSQSYVAGVSPDGSMLVTVTQQPKASNLCTLWNAPTPTPWLAILGGALIPTILVGLVWQLRTRHNSVQ